LVVPVVPVKKEETDVEEDAEAVKSRNPVVDNPDHSHTSIVASV